MADYCWVYGVIHFTSPAGWLPVHRDQLRAQRLVTSMGKLYLFTFTSPPHLKYVATLPCNLLLMACFADVNVSQGSVATQARCGGIFNIHLTTKLTRNLPVNFFSWNRLEIEIVLWSGVCGPLFGPSCIETKWQGGWGVSSFTCVVDMPHRRRLRSASTEQLDVPTCRRSTIGGHAFPVAGAKVWNSLPSDVTPASSLSVFKNRLKTYLFRCCYETVWL